MNTSNKKALVSLISGFIGVLLGLLFLFRVPVLSNTLLSFLLLIILPGILGIFGLVMGIKNLKIVKSITGVAGIILCIIVILIWIYELLYVYAFFFGNL